MYPSPLMQQKSVGMPTRNLVKSQCFILKRQNGQYIAIQIAFKGGEKEHKYLLHHLGIPLN